MALAVGLVAGVLIGSRMTPQNPEGERSTTAAAATAFAAVPGEIGAEDVSGPYDAADWPKNLSTLPGHEKWTWGAAQGIFAENPNRVYLLARGELRTSEPDTRTDQYGTPLSVPIGGRPWRSVTATACRAGGPAATLRRDGIWRGSSPP